MIININLFYLIIRVLQNLSLFEIVMFLDYIIYLIFALNKYKVTNLHS